MSYPPAAISVREIEMQARQLAESIGRKCLAGAIKDGNYLKAGSIAGDRGSSLVLNLAGANRGMWRDWSSGDQGDMIGLIEQAMFGGDRGLAVQWLKSELGLDDLDPGRLQQVRAQVQREEARLADEAAREAEAKKRGARALWLNGQQSIADTPAARYLEARGISSERLGHWPGALRFHAEVWNRDAGVKLPCMVSQMILPTGEHVATHRTWLGRDARTRAWVKADGADLGVPKGAAKKVLGKSRGAFVALRKGGSRHAMGQMRRPETLYVTEGIEDGLTVAMCKPDARVIAAYSLGNLGAIEFPNAIETIVLVADRDDGAREMELLERAIARQQARGHHVQLVLPPVGFKDINAWLLAGEAA
ncbi:MAG: toprim domain-containing protein [Candidatus Sphingomonas colombiensis]|nr:toprim domain-containing protein [Sphingomonas sp.]WEK43627.1 MAG: toprim domain-containing protein [Sphingomonas sp.]